MIHRSMLQRFACDFPLIEERALEHLVALANSQHEPLSAEHPFFTQLRQPLRPKVEVTSDNLAVLPVTGVLAYKPNVFDMLYFGVEDITVIHDQFNQLQADPSIRGILLDVHSPGGFVTGGIDLADTIARSSKPVVTWSGGDIASLAYLIGSQAKDCVVTSASGRVGSIGTYTYHVDASQAYANNGLKVEVIRNKEGTFKASGVFGTPLTDEQRSQIQAGVDKHFGDFKRTVLRARPDVPEDAMRGQVFDGREAKKNKLVDAIGDRAYALAVLRRAVRAA